MKYIKKTTTALLFSLTASMLLISSSCAYATESATTTSDNLLERPKWLPNLPKIDTSGFAPDSVQYLSLRKRLIEKDDKTALPEIEKLAKKGHVGSLVLIGYIFDQKPKLVKTDPKKAARYWYVAAKTGDPSAMYNLGILYLNGRGVVRDERTASMLFRQASKRGVYRAFYMTGQLLEKQVQYVPAMNEYSQCLNVKYLVQCKTRYGILAVTKVTLTPKEANRVINLLASASNQGDLDASYTIARLAAEGIVVNKNLSSMVYYLETMVRAPNTNNTYRELAVKMYQAYNPSEEDIKVGKDNYRIANAGNVSTPIYQYIDPKMPILDAGNIVE